MKIWPCSCSSLDKHKADHGLLHLPSVSLQDCPRTTLLSCRCCCQAAVTLEQLLKVHAEVHT